MKHKNSEVTWTEPEKKDFTFTPDPDDVKPTSAKEAYDELVKRTYDVPSIFRYARAARSHTERDSNDWNVWLAVEKLAMPKKESDV